MKDQGSAQVGCTVEKFILKWLRVKINTTFQGGGNFRRSVLIVSPAPLALLGQWWWDWMRWRWEGRDLPSLGERSPLLPHSSPHVARGDAPQGESRGRVMGSTTKRRCSERAGFETKWKGKQNKQQNGFASTSLVHSPCLSLVGLWNSVDVLNAAGRSVGELQLLQHSCCRPLTQTWCAWRKLTKEVQIISVLSR